MPGIIVGRELARSLNLYTGDTINVISPLGNITPLGMVPKMKQFLQEAALDFAVLAAAEGRRESVSETLRRNAADLDRVIQAHLAARRESILKEITDADPE